MSLWKSIVRGVDSRPGCVEAVRLAARLAREQSANLVVFARHEEAAPEKTARWSGLASDLRGEPLRMESVTGDPAEGIVKFARKSGCDLIVLGSYAHRRATLALASIVGKVLAHAPCEVIAVPCGMKDFQPDFPGQVA